jgi:hypothetical protein
MSNYVLTIDHQKEVLQSIFRRLERDQKFTCSISEYDQLIWLELIQAFSDTQVFKYLPALIRLAWQHEETRDNLVARKIQMPKQSAVHKMTAVLISKRRANPKDSEKFALRKRVSFLEQQFGELSSQVFYLMGELEALKAELEQQKNESRQLLLNAKTAEIIVPNFGSLDEPLSGLATISKTLIPN